MPPVMMCKLKNHIHQHNTRLSVAAHDSVVDFDRTNRKIIKYATISCGFIAVSALPLIP